MPLKNARSLDFLTKALSSELLQEIGGPTLEADILKQCRPENSGKMLTLGKLLNIFQRNDEKTLVFSYSVRMLNLIESFVKGRGWRFSRLDGSSRGRQTLVNEFNKDPTILIFLISTKAGGLGLNLVSASKVVIFDCNWNPTLDMQAQDRVYRLGQMKHVSVYRLVAQGTVEEVTYMRQLYKRKLQGAVLSSTRRRGGNEGRKGKGDKEMIKRDDCIDDVDRAADIAPEGDQALESGADDSDQDELCGAFEGIEGESTCRGELFGLGNLMQFQEESILASLRQKYSMSTGENSSSRSNDTNVQARRTKRANVNTEKLGLDLMDSSIAIGLVDFSTKDPTMLNSHLKISRDTLNSNSHRKRCIVDSTAVFEGTSPSEVTTLYDHSSGTPSRTFDDNIVPKVLSLHSDTSRMIIPVESIGESTKGVTDVNLNQQNKVVSSKLSNESLNDAELDSSSAIASPGKSNRRKLPFTSERENIISSKSKIYKPTYASSI